MSNVLSLRMRKYLLERGDSAIGLLELINSGVLIRRLLRTGRTRYLMNKLLGLPRALDDARFAFSA